MLVLTRKLHETLVIDSCIKVTIAQVRGDKVRIAIDAPDEVIVLREELHRVRQEFAEPATSVPVEAPAPATQGRGRPARNQGAAGVPRRAAR